MCSRVSMQSRVAPSRGCNRWWGQVSCGSLLHLRYDLACPTSGDVRDEPANVPNREILKRRESRLPRMSEWTLFGCRGYVEERKKWEDEISLLFCPFSTYFCVIPR